MSTFSLLSAQTLGPALAHVSPAAASLLIASVWRGALLALLVLVGLKCLPKLSASVRSAIWLCVLVIVIASPMLSLVASASGASVATTGLVHIDVRWSYALLAVWAAFSLIRLAQLAMSAVQLGRLARRASPITVGENVLSILSATRRRVALCSSSEVDRPSVIGFFHPRIMLPPDLLARLSEAELEQVLLHEMEHLRRRDDWTNLLQKISVALLPLHPVVIWLDRRLCLERELACDDGVLRATEGRKSYAACLTNLAEHSLVRRGVSLALGAIGGWKPKSEVAKRVCRILAKPEAVMGRVQTRFATGAVLASVLGGAMILAHAPHLISFTSDSSQTIAAAQEPINAGSSLTSDLAAPVRAIGARVSAPHAVLASAVAKSGSPRLMKATFSKQKQKGSALKQTVSHATKQMPQVDPLFRLAAWHNDEVPTARLALAIQQDSQFTYAAVPVRGGWLIVQL